MSRSVFYYIEAINAWLMQDCDCIGFASVVHRWDECTILGMEIRVVAIRKMNSEDESGRWIREMAPED